MNDELHEHLRSWQAPALPERTERRIASLLGDRSLPGPVVSTRRRMVLVPLAYAAAVSIVVVVMAPRSHDGPAVLSHRVVVARALVEAPNLPASARSSAIAVSAIDLEGFQAVARPRIRVNRRTP